MNYEVVCPVPFLHTLFLHTKLSYQSGLIFELHVVYTYYTDSWDHAQNTAVWGHTCNTASGDNTHNTAS